MKSLERRFNAVQKKNFYWSSFTCFAEAVTGQNFSKQAISRWFNKLVEKDDYERVRKKELIAFLINLSTHLRTTEIGAKLPRSGAFTST